MAVLEAMMDCYEKQLTLLEYNEESAEEIMMEYGIIMESDDEGGDTGESSEDGKKEPKQKKNIMKALKRGASRAIATLAKLGPWIVDKFMSMEFEKLAKALSNSYDISALAVKIDKKDLKFNPLALANMDTLMDIVSGYFDEFGDMKTLNDSLNYATEIQNKKATLEQYSKQIDDVLGKDGSHYSGLAVLKDKETRAKLIEFCKIAPNLKKQLRKFGENSAKFNTDYAENNNIPPELSAEMRKFTTKLLKFYSEVAKSISVLSKIYIDLDKDFTKNERKQDKAKAKQRQAQAKTNAKEDVDESAEDNEAVTGESYYSMALTDTDYDYYEESTNSDVSVGLGVGAAAGAGIGAAASAGVLAILGVGAAAAFPILGVIGIFGMTVGAGIGSLVLKKRIPKMFAKNVTVEIKKVIEFLGKNVSEDGDFTGNIRKLRTVNNNLDLELANWIPYEKQPNYDKPFMPKYVDKLPEDVQKKIMNLKKNINKIESLIEYDKSIDKDSMKEYIKSMNELLEAVYDIDKSKLKK
jgi:hypothetical protein